MSNRTTTDAANALRELLPVGSTVHTVLRHVSQSGMSRAITVHVITGGHIRDITYLVAQATGFRMSTRHQGLTVGGYGMDMGFHVVYSLSSTLYPTGHHCTGSTGYTPTGKRSKTPACPSNDHSNDYGRLSREYDALTCDPRPLAADENVAQRQAWIRNQKTYTRTRMHKNGGYCLQQRWL